MHCNLFSTTWSIALDDSLEGLAVLFPDLLFFSAEADVLLYCVCQAKRSLTLGSTMEKSLLLLCDESIENLLELVTITVCIKSKTRKSLDGLSEKSCLKPREAGIDTSLVSIVKLEEICIMHKKIVMIVDRAHLIENVSEFSLESARIHLVDGSRNHN